MKLRKGTGSDIDAIMKCYDTARQMMRTAGNHSQWINGYPSRELVAEDVANGISYVGVETLFPHVEALMKWGQENFEQIMHNRHKNI